MDKANKMLMQIIIILMLVAPCTAQEPVFDSKHGGPGPIPIISPDQIGRAGAAMVDLIGEETAVNETHWLFLYGNYENGSWMLNNTTA